MHISIGFNLSRVDCKYANDSIYLAVLDVLIYPEWIVNDDTIVYFLHHIEVLIYPEWIVNIRLDCILSAAKAF